MCLKVCFGDRNNRINCFEDEQVCLRAALFLFFFLNIPNQGHHLSTQNHCHHYALAAFPTTLAISVSVLGLMPGQRVSLQLGNAACPISA